jgi:hypothetical protein
VSTPFTSAADYGSTWHRKKPGEGVHAELVSYARAVQGAYRTAHQYNRIHQRMYLGTVLRRYGGALAALGPRLGGDALARLNGTKAVVDTVVARLSKRRAMPAFKVDQAEWSLKRRAKKFRNFILGKMTETDFEEISPLCLRDGGMVGNGIVQIDDSGDDVCAERVYLNELLIDPREAKYGKSWQMIRTMRVARDVLAEKFPDLKAQIMAAPSSQRQTHESIDDDVVSQLGSLEHYVDVYKAWRRPSTPDSKDGRYAEVIDDATLEFDSFECPRLPFAIFRYTHPPEGFWGYGLVEEVADLQHRVNRIVRAAQLNIDAVAMGSYAVNKNFRQPVEMMTGARPFEFVYDGPRAPEWSAPEPIAQQTIPLIEFFLRQMFELAGVSQAAASSKSSLGLGVSGVALDTQYDIESERFAMVERQYAKFRLDAAQCYLDGAARVAKRRYESKGEKKSRSYVSNWRNRDSIERLEYKDASIEADKYRLEMEPVNYIPDTRAGKFATIQELTAAGIIPQWLAPALYDEPDLQKAQMINCAAFFNQERIMEQLGDEGAPMIMPDAYHDLDIALKMAVAYVNYAESEGAPESVVSRYRQYADAVAEMKAPAAAPAPPMPDPMAAGAPPMDPGMPPVDPMAPMPPMDPTGGALPPMPMPVAA